MPADGPLFPVPQAKQYLTWEPDGGGLNNVRMQVRPAAASGVDAAQLPDCLPDPHLLPKLGPSRCYAGCLQTDAHVDMRQLCASMVISCF